MSPPCYNLESKGYQIYWPQKCSITVKHNIIFNESNIIANNDVHITAGDAVDEGERDKVLQPPTSNANATNAPNSAPAPQPKAPEPTVEPKPQILVPFPSADSQTDIPEDKEDWEAELPPNLALIGALGTQPKSLNDVLSRPCAKEWKTALDYEISQLEKPRTWVIEDLLKGQNMILCSAVLKQICGPDGKITSYQVQIVAGGCRQVEGVNYSEMFSAANMPTVQVVPANTAMQDWEIEHIDIKSAYLNVT